jgi:hypothetical protein
VQKARLGRVYNFDPSAISFSYDSSYLYFDKNGKDSLYLLFDIDDVTNEITLSKKVSQTSTGIDNSTTITTVYNTTGDSTITKSIFNDYSSNRYYVTQIFKYEDLNWKLTELDTTFYEADSISGRTNIYSYDLLGDWRLTSQQITSTSMVFEQGNPVPVAPSNLNILVLLGSNLRAEITPEYVDYQLTWDDNSYNEDGFLIYRREAGTNDTPILLDSTDRNVEMYVDANVSSSVVYEYFVVAFTNESASGSNGYTSAPSNARTDGSTVGVKDQLVLQNTTIAPNPVIGNTINLVGINESMNYSILNMQGQEISSGAVVNGTIENNLQSGIYLLKLNKNDSIKVIKFEVK